jgi:hypothetical protein
MRTFRSGGTTGEDNDCFAREASRSRVAANYRNGKSSPVEVLDEVLALWKQFELAYPWANRRPEL